MTGDSDNVLPLHERLRAEAARLLARAEEDEGDARSLGWRIQAARLLGSCGDEPAVIDIVQELLGFRYQYGYCSPSQAGRIEAFVAEVIGARTHEQVRALQDLVRARYPDHVSRLFRVLIARHQTASGDDEGARVSMADTVVTAGELAHQPEDAEAILSDEVGVELTSQMASRGDPPGAPVTETWRDAELESIKKVDERETEPLSPMASDELRVLLTIVNEQHRLSAVTTVGEARTARNDVRAHLDAGHIATRALVVSRIALLLGDWDYAWALLPTGLGSILDDCGGGRSREVTTDARHAMLLDETIDRIVSARWSPLALRDYLLSDERVELNFSLVCYLLVWIGRSLRFSGNVLEVERTSAALQTLSPEDWDAHQEDRQRQARDCAVWLAQNM